jgi:hypothetical protein
MEGTVNMNTPEGIKTLQLLEGTNKEVFEHLAELKARYQPDYANYQTYLILQSKMNDEYFNPDAD